MRAADAPSWAHADLAQVNERAGIPRHRGHGEERNRPPLARASSHPFRAGFGSAYTRGEVAAAGDPPLQDYTALVVAGAHQAEIFRASADELHRAHEVRRILN